MTYNFKKFKIFYWAFSWLACYLILLWFNWTLLLFRGHLYICRRRSSKYVNKLKNFLFLRNDRIVNAFVVILFLYQYFFALFPDIWTKLLVLNSRHRLLLIRLAGHVSMLRNTSLQLKRFTCRISNVSWIACSNSPYRVTWLISVNWHRSLWL